MDPFLNIERDGPVVTVTLNRPQARNTITAPEQSEEIVAFCASAKADVTIRAIILTGAGAAFCAGGNVKHMRERSGMFAGSPYTLRNAYRTSVQMIAPALHDLEVPVIAAINGAAIGLGLDLACMCDIRIAADNAVMAESYVKLGIVPGGGGAWLLPRIVGNARAHHLVLTGESFTAAQAFDYGLVSEVLAPDDLMPRARTMAAAIAANPGHATRLAKRLLRESQSVSLTTSLELAAAYQALCHHTEDHMEAVSAFIDRRTPEMRDA